MQSFAQTPAAATQHLPEGWGFPVAGAPAAVASVPAIPVSGGGAIAPTMIKVRWGRLLLMLAGVLVVGFGGWAVAGSGGGTNNSTAPRTAPSSDMPDEVDVVRASRGVGVKPPISAPTNAHSTTPKTPVAKKPAAKAPARPATTAPVAKTPVTRTPAKNPTKTPARGTRVVAGGGAAVAPALAAPSSAVATPTSPSVRGGGASPADGSELPLTGIESWIAAALGILLLGFGICIHINAVRIGMTALLYRRGILLRPVDCARLAHRHGLPRLRVLLSNVLHHLLQEPATAGEFVSARRIGA